MREKESQFYKALEGVFVGAQVDGQGGFINLMRMKSAYYGKIKDKLKFDINQALSDHPKFREELFEKLYDFFNRYFTQNGSIYFNKTAFHNNVYEKVYTGEQDVVLFWKTQMLYYVKTDILFCSMPVEFDGMKFHFDASTIVGKKANEKRDLVFAFTEQKEYTLHFSVAYAENGRKTNLTEIRRAIPKNFRMTDDILSKAFAIFKRQSECDFFINKNASAFLKEQFKLWSYNYLWEGSDDWQATRIAELQILKTIAFKTIDFIGQFEDELARVWNKPKFAKNANYVITLDRLDRLDPALVKKIKAHEGYASQRQEWQALGVDEGNAKAPIDTKFFKDLEWEILAQFDNLDEALDGWLIKSENYQALNTLLPKFQGKVQTIYIDPPFNLDTSDQFLYRTNYKDANWATLLENRLQIARDWLREDGSIFVRCDYNGNWIVRCLMDEVFGKENFRNEIVIAKTKEFFKTMKNLKQLAQETESLFFYSNQNGRNLFNEIYVKIEPTTYPPFLPAGDKNYQDSRDIDGKKWDSPMGRKWGIKQEDIPAKIERNELIIEGGKVLLRTDKQMLKNNWTDFQGYARTTGFKTENSEKLLARVITTASEKDKLVFDFFLGSGTTTAVAHKLGRKWLGVEMGEHFYGVVLPRMKKVLAGNTTGITKDVNWQGGGFFKYYELEQYEETLANCKYEDGDVFTHINQSVYEQYVFLRDEKMLDAIELDFKKNQVAVNLGRLYDGIDIAETLSHQKGTWIKSIKKGKVEFADGSAIDPNNLDYKDIKKLIWWERDEG